MFKNLVDILKVKHLAGKRLLLTSLLFLSAQSVMAVCTDPAGTEGEVVYNTTSKVVQFCDGNAWKTTAQDLDCGAPVGGSGCSSPVGTEGEMVYNSSQKVMQFCNGTSWMKMGGSFPCECLAYSQPYRVTMDEDAPLTTNFFGSGPRVSVDGNYVVYADTTGFGTVHVHDASTGTQLHKMQSDDGALYQRLGFSVDLDGTTLVAGAPYNWFLSDEAGAVYVFDVSTGTQLRKIQPDDSVGDDTFGQTVAVDGDLLVAANYAGYGLANAADLAIYGFNVNTGVQTQKIVLSGSVAIDDMELDGNTVVFGQSSVSSNSGEAYVYNMSTGALVHTLTPSQSSANYYFGKNLDIGGGYIAVNAFRENVSGNGNAGAVYIFNATTGAEVHRLTAPSPQVNGYFGADIDIDPTGKYIIVGEYGRTVGGNANQGQVYIFDIATGDLLRELSNDTLAASDQFGIGVAMEENYFVVGASNADTADTNRGAIFKYGCE